MTEDVHTEIRRHYEAYGGDFSGLDADAAVGHWHAPSIRTAPDGVTLDAAVADRWAGFAAAIEDLAATDYDHSEAVAIGAHRLSASLALSNVVWHRLTDDGTVMARFSPLHVLRWTGERWQFVARATRRSDDPLAMRPVGRRTEELEPARTPGSVVDFVESYGRAVSTGDRDAVVAAWSRPSLVLAPDGVRAVTTAEEVEPLVEGPVEPEAVYAHELDASVAVADVRWAHPDGDAGGPTATVHLLHESVEGWQFVASGRHPPENLVAVGPPGQEQSG